jgi:hypothetical protein
MFALLALPIELPLIDLPTGPRVKGGTASVAGAAADPSCDGEGGGSPLVKE